MNPPQRIVGAALVATVVFVAGCFRCGGADSDSGCLDCDSGAACDEGDTMCAGDDVVTCAGGGWGLPQPCATGEACNSLSDQCGPPKFCEPGEVSCIDDSVVQCNALGDGTTMVEVCPPPSVCAGGSCVSACVRAELRAEAMGCEYYALDTNNVSHDDPLPFEVVLANSDATTTADVTIATRDVASGAWTPVATGSVAPGTALVLPLPDRHLEGTAVGLALAYRVTSTLPVSAWQFNSRDAMSASSGATWLVAVPALEPAYYAVTLPTSVGNDALFDFGAEIHHSGFAAVATEDDTIVTFTVSAATLAAPGIPALVAGDSFDVSLDAGDALQIEGAAVGDDLTGSFVSGDKPIALFAYHECATLAPGSCDHIEELMLPTIVDALGLFGTTYPCARIFEGGPSHMWRFLAFEDATTITFEYEAGTNGLPPPSGSSIMLNAGEWFTIVVSGPTAPGAGPASENIGDFLAIADKAISVMQFAMEEPAMTSVGPADYGARTLLVAALPFFDDTLTLVDSPGAPPASLDGAPVTAWAPFASGFELHRSALADGTHLIAGGADPGLGSPAPVGLYLSGRAGSAAYGLVGGVRPRCQEYGDDVVCF